MLPSASAPSDLPTNTIITFHGAVADIPFGFALCDGTGGTPDLRDSFVRGASAGAGSGASGGSNTHLHTHAANGGTHYMMSTGGGGASNGFKDSGGYAYPEDTENASTLPVYYALLYIMKT